MFDEETGIVIPGQAAVEIVAPDPSFATGINENGDVTGEYLWSIAFVYTDADGYSDIGNLGGSYAYPAAINNLGQVAGSSEKADGEIRAFLYTPGFGMEDLGIIKTWKNRRDDHSQGRALNDSGVVVGNASAGTQKGQFADHAFREAGEGMEDLGTLGGLDSHANSINATGDIIGRTGDLGLKVDFLYTNEFGMVDLETLITNLPAHTYFSTNQINDAGEISGQISFADGTREAFLLTPNP